MNNIHWAAFFTLLQVINVFNKSICDLKDALKGGADELREALVIHLEILRCDVSAEAAPDTFGFLVTDFYHNRIFWIQTLGIKRLRL